MKVTYSISETVISEILETIGKNIPEQGGILGGNRETLEIVSYFYDQTAQKSGITYSPNVNAINKVVQSWEKNNIEFMGFIHSHPSRFNIPSTGDEIYVRRILEAMPSLKRLFLPIFNFDTAQILPFSRCFISSYSYRLDENNSLVQETPTMRVIRDGKVFQEGVRVMIESRLEEARREETIFDRVEKAYNLPLMRESRVVAVGAGGAADYLENLTRAGIGQLVLIDPDVVSITNIGTQQTYITDIGKSKVEVLADRLRLINPEIEIITKQLFLDDLSDTQMRQLLFDPTKEGGFRPRTTLLCGLTDSFKAQARVNRLALQFAVPSMCAQVYERGAGCEVTFTHPDFTQACHRCALSGRYAAYMNGEIKDIGSEGTPIFATIRLNALKGYITLALLHANDDHPLWSKIIPSVATRNLAMTRMDPDIAEVLGLGVFDKTFGRCNKYVYFDETIWTEVTPDSGDYICPDCGGTGNLRDAAGTYENTITAEKVKRDTINRIRSLIGSPSSKVSMEKSLM